MAKRSSSNGSPSTGLIVTLVFFILTTFIAGTLAYFGFADQKTAEENKKKAETTAKQNQDAFEKEQARRLVNVIATRTASEKEVADFQGFLGRYDAEIRDEISKLVAEVGEAGGFVWAADKDRPESAPKKNLISILKENRSIRDSETKAKLAAEENLKATQQQMATEKKKFDDDKAKLQLSVSNLQAKLDDAEKKKKVEFEELVKALSDKDQSLAAVRTELAQLTEDKKRSEDKLAKDIADRDLKIKGYENKIVGGPDLLKLDTKKADITKRDGTFIILNRGSNDYLRPQTTFAVLPGEATWRDAEEREKLIKGEIEVVEILGPNSARAKILSERSGVRNPIRANDQLFNVAWTPGIREHIAFAGIIDLNGDGIDDNKLFISVLEKQGVVIDQYLDLQDRTIKGKGMTISTKFLVLGADVILDEDFQRRKDRGDPRVVAQLEVLGKIAEMKAAAAKLGVQVIEYRKFLASIGVKPPESPARADYGASIYIQKGDKEKALEEAKDSGK